MPTLNFKTKAIKTTKVYKQAVIADKVAEDVYPTIFDCTIKTKTVDRLLVDDSNNGHTIIEHKTNASNCYFAQVLLPFHHIMAKCNSKEKAIALIVLRKLQWNSNIVHLSYEEVNKEIPMSLRFYTDSIANLRRYNLIASVDIDNNTYVINHNAMFFGNFNQFIETYNKLYDGKYAPVNKYNKINLRNTTLDDFVDNIDEYFRNNIYDNILTKEEINRAAATNQNKVR
jgi:hypothetical protein